MAKIEGTQTIPAEWNDGYRKLLTPKLPDGTCRKRFPYRLPKMQEGGSGVSAGQAAQRSRFKATITKFKSVNSASRARWYAAPVNLLGGLWYFDYFQMSGLRGNAEINGQGAGVIKDINHYTFSLASGTAPVATVAIDTCDPSKSVPFFFGNGCKLEENIPIVVYPYMQTLGSTQMIVAASMGLDYDAALSVTLIEYI